MERGRREGGRGERDVEKAEGRREGGRNDRKTIETDLHMEGGKQYTNIVITPLLYIPDKYTVSRFISAPFIWVSYVHSV